MFSLYRIRFQVGLYATAGNCQWKCGTCFYTCNEERQTRSPSRTNSVFCRFITSLCSCTAMTWRQSWRGSWHNGLGHWIFRAYDDWDLQVVGSSVRWYIHVLRWEELGKRCRWYRPGINFRPRFHNQKATPKYSIGGARAVQTRKKGRSHMDQHNFILDLEPLKRSNIQRTDAEE